MPASIKIKILRSLKSNPVLFSTIWRLREHKSFLRHAVRKKDELVIEGFPRCGNTFATHAFLYAQKRPVRVANHFHAPAQIIGAAKWKIPAILLIRKPEDAVISYAVYKNTKCVHPLIENYIWFYKSLLPVIDWPVIADFQSVTTDFGKVVEAVNIKYKTDFKIFNHTKESGNIVFTEIEQRRVQRSGNNPDSSKLRSTIPSLEKDKIKNTIEMSLTNNKEVVCLLKDATKLYTKILQLASKHPTVS